MTEQGARSPRCARAAELVAEIGQEAFDAIPDCGCEGWQPLKAPVITSEAAE